MKLSLVSRIAFRYLRGKGSANAVPILSRISMIAIGVSSCAMIILFSVMNGFGDMINDLYKAFYPEIKIVAAEGKFFTPSVEHFEQLKKIKGIAHTALVLEDKVLVNTELGETIPVNIKGVSADYFLVNDIKPHIVKGNSTLLTQPLPTAIIGQHIASMLGIDVDNVFARMMLYYPNTDAQAGNFAPTDAFQSLTLKPDGVFSVQDEFDSKYILAPLPEVQVLMKQKNAISSLEIKLVDDASVADVQEKIKEQFGKKYRVENRYEQNKTVYMVMQSEKWAGFVILLFVLLIASFNMVSALSLLVLEKQKDMGILRSMGMQPAQLSIVVLLEGVLWALVGGGIGLTIGLLLCWAQVQFQLIKIPGSFIIDAYPVSVQFTDVLVVLATIIFVGFLAAIYPARRAATQKLNEIMTGK